MKCLRLALAASVMLLAAGCGLQPVYAPAELATTPTPKLYDSFAYWGGPSVSFLDGNYESHHEYLQAVRCELADRMDCDEHTRRAIKHQEIFVGMPKWAAWLSWGPWSKYDETRYHTAYSDTTYVNIGPPSAWQQITFDGDKVRNWFVEER